MTPPYDSEGKRFRVPKGTFFTTIEVAGDLVLLAYEHPKGTRFLVAPYREGAICFSKLRYFGQDLYRAHLYIEEKSHHGKAK